VNYILPTKRTRKIQFHSEAIFLAKSVGDFMQYWGFNKLHGQIWCLVFISQTPLSGQDLALALGVSKTAISLAIQELIFYEVIIPTERGPRNTIYYQSNPDIEKVITNVLKNRELKLIENSAKLVRELKEVERESPQTFPILHWDRIEELETMIQQASNFLRLLIETQLEVERLKAEAPSPLNESSS